jgi:L-asparaginase/beta-aspartyl-peptidase (threonine type)
MSTMKQSSAVVVHGGAGESHDLDDGCIEAAHSALDALAQGREALDAAIAAVTVLENDGRFNAGSGADLGLDGKTIEMDASVMDTRGRLGAIACVRGVKNPVQLARAVADTPHVLLAGDGALLFARHIGHPEYREVSELQRKKYQEMLEQLARPGQAMAGVDNREFIRLWNYDAPLPLPLRKACDTVGAVVRDRDGHFAVAGSTGGSAPSLLGRVGDTPIIGSGFYAGPKGAVAATGIGEYIVRHMLAHTVYSWLADGMPLARALQRGIDLFSKDVPVGLIAVSATEAGACSNTDMPQSRMIQ